MCVESTKITPINPNFPNLHPFHQVQKPYQNPNFIIITTAIAIIFIFLSFSSLHFHHHHGPQHENPYPSPSQNRCSDREDGSDHCPGGHRTQAPSGLRAPWPDRHRRPGTGLEALLRQGQGWIRRVAAVPHGVRVGFGQEGSVRGEDAGGAVAGGRGVVFGCD